MENLARAALLALVAIAVPACWGAAGHVPASAGAAAPGSGQASAGARAPVAGEPQTSTAPPQQALFAPPPDKSQLPWSQTRIPPIGIGEVARTTEAGGRHFRLGTVAGVVHAWEPPGYDRNNAGIAIYLHGYYTDADQAWIDHRLSAQFRASRRNALFLVAESPAWSGEDVWWPDLEKLLAEVSRAGVQLPRGPLVVIGHSGAFRTILAWLPDPRLEEVLLLDGLYRGEEELATWLAGAAPGQRRLVLVGQETAARTEAWLDAFPAAIRRIGVPARASPRGDPDRAAAIFYVRSQLDHMGIVTSGRVMPVLLQMSRLPRLPG